MNQDLVSICKKCRLKFRQYGMRSRFCPGCKMERKKERQEKRIDRRKREGEYPQPEVKWWNEQKKQRTEGIENTCAICEMKESECKTQFGCGLTRDHLLPARFIINRGLGDPQLDINIVLTCSACCGKKTAAEIKLFNGDVLGFLTDLKKWGWNMEELELVLKHYHFYLDRWDELLGVPVRQL
jgi:hypothetical protein